MFGIKERCFQVKYMMKLNTDRIKTAMLNNRTLKVRL